MTYQDVWSADRIVAKGDRECASRYNAIADTVLSTYSRPFTILDLGAAQGYFSMRAAHEFNCVAVALDGGAQLADTVRRYAPRDSRIVCLQHRATVETLERLAACEHFDVVLALNVAHHFAPAEVTRALDALFAMGDTLILETPPPHDTGACGQATLVPINDYLAAQPEARLVTTTASHTAAVQRSMWRFDTPKSRLARPYYDAPAIVCPSDAVISSTRREKLVSFTNKPDVAVWIPGLNLRTYQRLGGAYPAPREVAAMVESTPLPASRHGDIRPWNFILDGRAVHLIDGRDAKAIYDDREGLDMTAAQLREGVAR